MANLSDLVAALSQVTGIPDATIFAYGRFAREGGVISQNGRGLSAATMSTGDAANLLIAVAGTAVTRDAASTVENFRKLRGRIWFCVQGFREHFLQWLSPLGVSDQSINADFGQFMEFLISQAGDFHLTDFLQTIPVTLWPLPPSHYQQGDKPEHELSNATQIALQILPPPSLVVGEEVSLEVEFNRSALRAEIRVERLWAGNTQELLRIVFFPPDTTADPLRKSSDLTVTSRISDSTLRILGLALRNIRVPPHLKQQGEITSYLIDCVEQSSKEPFLTDRENLQGPKT